MAMLRHVHIQQVETSQLKWFNDTDSRWTGLSSAAHCPPRWLPTAVWLSQRHGNSDLYVYGR